MAPHLLGLGLALAAAAGNNLGKGLQKAATGHLPQLNLARKEVVLAYLSNPTWLTGLLMDVGGGAAMIGALATSPVSLVQPVAAFGLVLLAGFSHFVLQERLGPSQWRGAALATLGIIGMGISSSSSTSSSDASIHPAAAAAAQKTAGSGAAAAAAATAAAVSYEQQPSPWRVLWCFVLLLGLLGVEVLWRQQHEAAASAKRKRTGAAVGVGVAEAAAAADAAACGLEAGCCFGFSAAAARTGFQLAQSFGWLFVPMGLAASVGLTSSGFVLQTRGFKHGSAIVVCTTAAAASIVAGVLVGLLALAEPLPASQRLKLLLLASWGAVFAGVSSMAGSEGSSNNAGVFSPRHPGAHHEKADDGKAGPGSASSSSSSSTGRVLSGLRDRAEGVLRELLLLLPRGLRRRVVPQRTRHWLGRGVGGGLVGVWQAMAGPAQGSAKGHPGVHAVEGHQGLGFGGSAVDDVGPGLPVSKSSPDFAGVLAPAGGARR